QERRREKRGDSERDPCHPALDREIVVQVVPLLQGTDPEQGEHGRRPQALLRRGALQGGVPTDHHTARFTISCLISPIACAGFRPLGQVLVQFMMVWQRYSRNGSSRSSRRVPVSSSRESMIQR